MWLDQKDWPSYSRPDKSGVIVSYRGVYKEIPIVVATQVWPNAVESAIGKEIIETLKDNGMFIAVHGVGVCCYHLGIYTREQVDEIVSFLGADSAAVQEKHRQVPFEFV